jgi:broad specificity phosphatase PhoE
MGEIYLIRHGETEWNREQVFRGRADVPLSDRGRDQARLLADSLSESSLEAVYSSPLSRARETAAPLCGGLGLDLLTEEGFVDMSFGEWEGVSVADVRRRWPDLSQTWMRSPEEFRAPGGEALAEVLVRAWSALEKAAERHGAAAVVSHRVVCKLLLCRAVGVGEAGFWRMRVDTASLSVLESEGDKWVVTGMNDVSHLSALGERDAADF